MPPRRNPGLVLDVYNFDARIVHTLVVLNTIVLTWERSSTNKWLIYSYITTVVGIISQLMEVILVYIYSSYTHENHPCAPQSRGYDSPQAARILQLAFSQGKIIQGLAVKVVNPIEPKYLG